MKKHYIEFLSPGTMISETNLVEVAKFSVDEAKVLAKDIIQRHGAKPYGFRFITRSRSDQDLDSKVTYKSGIHYLGGQIYTYNEVVARNDPKEEILRWNMRVNNIKRIIVNTNSYRSTFELRDEDCVV